ncbi:hypothetical protein Dimus_030115 [Dionaea muscipula]
MHVVCDEDLDVEEEKRETLVVIFAKDRELPKCTTDAGEGKKRNRQLKKKFGGDDTKTESKPKKTMVPRVKQLRQEYIRSVSGEPTDLQRVVPSDVPEREVNDLITSARQRSFISDVVVDEQVEKDPFGLLCISLGSDGRMSAMLGPEKMVELETTETVVDGVAVITRPGFITV